MEGLYRKKLFRLRDKSISIHIDVCIDKDTGSLVIEGHDVGRAVSAAFGDSDYEYWLTIKKENKPRLFELFAESDPEAVAAAIGYTKDQDRDKALVALIQKHFSQHDVVSKLQESCESKAIPCEFFSYS